MLETDIVVSRGVRDQFFEPDLNCSNSSSDQSFYRTVTVLVPPFERRDKDIQSHMTGFPFLPENSPENNLLGGSTAIHNP